MLVGRGAEMREISQLVAGARVGRSAVVVLSGEAGIGKTALLGYAAAEAAGMNVLWARGNEAETGVAFGGLLQLLRPAIHLLDAVPGPQRQALASALALEPAGPGDRFGVGAATLTLLCRYAEEAPLAILVDDLHLIDRPSVDAVLFAGRRLVADPVIVCAALRPGELPGVADDLHTLALSGLGPDAARALVRERAVDITEEPFERLYSATAGNPLALLELARDFASWRDDPAELPLPAPSVVARAFTRRLVEVSPAARSALLAAAVSAGDLRVAAGACERLGIDVEGLVEAEDAGLVTVGEGRAEFRHPLLRSAVYGGAGAEERRAMHEAVAGVLPESDLDRRAWHLAAAALGVDAGVADLLARAGDLAAGRRAHAVASTSYEHAARFTPSPQVRSERLVDAAEQSWLAGSAERASSLLDEADRGTRSSAVRAAIAARTGSLTEARDVLVAAAAAEPDDDAAAVLLAQGVYTCFYLADPAGALRIAGRIGTLQPRLSTSKAAALATMAEGVAQILAGLGGTDRVRRAVDLLTAAQGAVELDAQQRAWLMVGPLWLREARSGDELRRAAAQARERSAIGELPFLLFHLGRDEATTNQWSRAEATYSEAIQLARETGQSSELAITSAGLAWLQARRGNDRECRANAEVAIETGTARQVNLALVWTRLALGDLALALADPTEALARYAAAEELMSELGVADVDLSPTPEQVDAMVRLGRLDGARERAEQFAQAADAKGQPWACARAKRTLGLAGSDDDLDVHFGAALDLHARTLDAFEAACTQLAYGARLRRARRRVDARPLLREAAATFDDLGAEPWAQRAGVELEATGEHVVRGDRVAEALTPQELQIALLLVEGRTTREAAAAMFLSPKTVEYHLRKVYTRLGIRSRAELAAAIRSRVSPVDRDRPTGAGPERPRG